MLPLGVFLLSAATLLLEVGLTRFFSLTQWYHFAFWVVSIALLGFGASGSFLSAFGRLRRWNLSKVVSGAAGLFGATAVGGYLVANLVPFDSFRVAWDSRQWLLLALDYLALTSPFFLSGLVLGVLLARRPEEAGLLYGSSLAGSGLGALLAVLVLAGLGTAAVPLVAAALGLAAATAFAWPRGRWMALSGLATVAGAAMLLNTPGALEPLLSPYKGLSHARRQAGAAVVWSGENAFSRVDVIRGAALHFAPGLSLAYPGTAPVQPALAIDGDDLSPIPQTGPAEADFLDYLPTALPYRLRPAARVLLIEPGGGMDVLMARRQGAQSVDVVIANPEVEQAVRAYSRVLDAPSVRVNVDSPRTYLRRSTASYDLVQLSLAEGFRVVTAGAHSLSENYLYTREAFAECYGHLAPGGLLVVTRWLQVPPSEEARAFALLVEALEQVGQEPTQTLVALRSFQTVTMLAKRGPFTAEELAQVRRFAAERRFDLVYAPGLTAAEANQHNVFEPDEHFSAFQAILTPATRSQFYADYPFEVAPTTDDRPFFFHFFRPQQTPAILQQLGRTWQPFGGGGYLVTAGALGLAVAASGLLIFLPLALSGRAKPGAAGAGGGTPWRLGAYFLALGMAFMLVEVPLLQRFILFLGQPTYSFAVVLAVLLMASGAGSLASGAAGRRWFSVVAVLAVMAALYPRLLSAVFDQVLGQTLALRLLVAVVLLAPLGFAMGVPFPLGLRLAGRLSPGAIPWLWAVNGCASVVSAVLAPMLALAVGLSWVLVAGGAAYGLALVAILPLVRSRQST